MTTAMTENPVSLLSLLGPECLRGGCDICVRVCESMTMCRRDIGRSDAVGLHTSALVHVPVYSEHDTQTQQLLVGHSEQLRIRAWVSSP